MNHVYMVVQCDETGKTREVRVMQERLADFIKETFATGLEILAVIRLPERK